jgi:hypothetical protein
MDQSKHFAICVQNEGYEGTLELRKLYEIIADSTAEKYDQVRVVDESGEDYLYPRDWFLSVELPEAVEAQLAHLAGK